MMLQELVLNVPGNENVKVLVPGDAGSFVRDSLEVCMFR